MNIAKEIAMLILKGINPIKAYKAVNRAMRSISNVGGQYHLTNIEAFKLSLFAEYIKLGINCTVTYTTNSGRTVTRAATTLKGNLQPNGKGRSYEHLSYYYDLNKNGVRAFSKENFVTFA